MRHATTGSLRLGRLGLVLLVAAGAGAIRSTVVAGEVGLVFDPATFALRSQTVGGQTIRFRAYEGLVYVARPADPALQRMNVYVPVEYFEGGTLGAYDASTAPIFLPNTVGGYMPGPPGSPGPGRDGSPNAALLALSRGYVVAAPGVRGRTSQDAAGRNIGKAPAAIVDLKAAVRYLRLNDARMPGNAGRIISNGTSAGGALSALLGASGNHPDFVPYLQALGAADTRDDIYATSAYCPITNLENADAGYEWQFRGVNEYTRVKLRGPAPGGPPGGSPGGPGAMPPAQPPPGAPPAGASAGTMTAEQGRLSNALALLFPGYLNSLELTAPDGTRLALDPSGNGSFKTHLISLIVASAQQALATGTDVSSLSWMTVRDGRVTGIDFEQYVRFSTRMKVPPAFDGLDLGTPENELFGTETVKARHFTRFGQEHTTVPATLADPAEVRLMNAMRYIGAPGAVTAKYWRIRHGTLDRDTSLAIPVILATRLGNAGHVVDFALPWGVGHAGDYDLDALLDWMARIVRQAPVGR
jgi:hypothetical protein